MEVGICYIKSLSYRVNVIISPGQTQIILSVRGPGWVKMRGGYTDRLAVGMYAGSMNLQIYGSACIQTCRDVQCESKKIPPPWGLVAIFPKRLGIFQPNFTCLLRIPVYARERIFIKIFASLMKLCHIKRDHPVKIMCAKCPPSAKTHFLTFSPNSLEFLV